MEKVSITITMDDLERVLFALDSYASEKRNIRNEYIRKNQLKDAEIFSQEITKSEILREELHKEYVSLL